MAEANQYWQDSGTNPKSFLLTKLQLLKFSIDFNPPDLIGQTNCNDK